MRHFNWELCLVMGILILYFTFFFSALALADSRVTATWTEPTAREDGSSLLSTDIAGYRLYISSTEGLEEKTIWAEVPVGATSHSVDQVVEMGECKWFVITAVDISGLESKLSNLESKCNYSPLALPRFPSNFKVE